MELTEADVRPLSAAIVEQAVSDYQRLKKSGRESATENRLCYGIEEIEEFFNHTWSDRLIKDGLRLWIKDGDRLRSATGKDVLASAVRLITTA